jgi:hypothetical protein
MLKVPSTAFGGFGAAFSPCRPAAPVSCAGYVDGRHIKPFRDLSVLAAKSPGSTAAVGNLTTAPDNHSSTESSQARRTARRVSHAIDPALQPTITPNRTSRHTNLQQPTSQDPDSPNSIDGQDGSQLSHRRVRQPGITKPIINPDDLIDILVTATQLPRATAERVVAARHSSTGIPQQPDKLCRRVQCLQQLLGTDNADLALRRYPSILAHRCEPLGVQSMCI